MRDSKDDKFVACGLSGGAEHLVAYDDDLLMLGVVGGMQILRLIVSWALESPDLVNYNLFGCGRQHRSTFARRFCFHIGCRMVRLASAGNEWHPGND